jgi:hypothetical protein
MRKAQRFALRASCFRNAFFMVGRFAAKSKKEKCRGSKQMSSIVKFD